MASRQVPQADRTLLGPRREAATPAGRPPRTTQNRSPKIKAPISWRSDPEAAHPGFMFRPSGDGPGDPAWHAMMRCHCYGFEKWPATRDWALRIRELQNSPDESWRDGESSCLWSTWVGSAYILFVIRYAVIVRIVGTWEHLSIAERLHFILQRVETGMCYLVTIG